MLKIKKIKAFTVLEVLISMVIASIVVGLALMILSLFQRNIILIQGNYSQSAEMSLIEQRLAIDFNRYPKREYDKTSERLYLKNTLDSIFYEFSDNVFFRNTDTLYSGSLDKKLYFEGREIQQGIVDALRVEFFNDKNQSFIFMYSEKDSQQTLKNYGN